MAIPANASSTRASSPRSRRRAVNVPVSHQDGVDSFLSALLRLVGVLHGGGFALIPVVVVLRMDVAVVEIVDMSRVLDRSVAAAGAVLMRVFVVGRVVGERHARASCAWWSASLAMCAR